MTSAERVQFYFDPICPWAYEASRWIREVRHLGLVDVEWRFFSLETINREPGKKFPWERRWSYGWSMMRVAAYLRRRDVALVDRWYAANGEAFFRRGERVFTEEGAGRVLERIGFPASVVSEAIDDQTTNDDVRADHDTLVTRHAGHGVPTLVFDDGQALFGPVIREAPRGAQARALWDLVCGYRRFPQLYEMRRPKTAADHAAIDEFLDVYVNTRVWRTIQRDPDADINTGGS